MHPAVLFQRGCGSLGASTDEMYFYADQPLEFSDQRVKGTKWTSGKIKRNIYYIITSMKVRQDYTNLHLAQLFSCSVSTIANSYHIDHVIHLIY